MKYTFLVFFISLFFFNCTSTSKADDVSMDKTNSTSNIERYWINSARVDCVGAFKQTCYQIQKGDTLRADAWQFFYDQIQNFDFEPGNIYHLRIEKKPIKGAEQIADGPTFTYTNVELISRTPDLRLKLHNIFGLEAIAGENIDAQKANFPNIEFNVAQSRVNGTDGCNSFFGEAIIGLGGDISIGKIGQTKKMCLDHDTKTSSRFMASLGKATDYAFRNGKLFLSDSDGKVMLRLKPID